MDKLLNLLAAIQDENWRYTAEVLPIEVEGEYDFLVNCSKHIETGERISFNFDPVIEVLDDFSDYSISGYVSEGSPIHQTEDGVEVVEHEVEIMVKR